MQPLFIIGKTKPKGDDHFPIINFRKYYGH